MLTTGSRDFKPLANNITLNQLTDAGEWWIWKFFEISPQVGLTAEH